MSLGVPPRSRRHVRARHAPWRGWAPALAVLGLLLLAPALARAQAAAPDSVTLRWTAVGDDSLTGVAAAYDLRMAATPISESNWGEASPLAGLPAPLASGTPQQVVVRGLTAGTTYYFALRVRDDAGNWSGLSNVVRWDGTLDAAPPAAPSGVAAEPRGAGMYVHWAASTAPDLAGYSVYRATARGGPYTKLNAALLTVAEYQDDALPEGAADLWYEVTATDASGNESARSASAGRTPRVEGMSAWRLAPPYPNPSRVGESLHIPVDIVDAGSAWLDVVDAAGHRVRRLDLRALEPGHQEVEWDGRNDAGRPVAPGPYRAWLIAGDARCSTRVARVP